MKFKHFGLIFLCNFLSILAKPTNENVSIISESASNHTSKHVIGNMPIVIHTQIQHYDQPTLQEYEECHFNLEKCKRVCQDVKDPISCVKECPICPLLVKEKVVVQGVNDTYTNSESATPLNTTNIIRLTNQIQNIIDHQQGNINYVNENIVHVHQNISRVGGKFGLGYNNTDPCCIVVSSSLRCNSERFSTANRCHHKRHRMCGKHCTSRIMLRRHVNLCKKSNPLDEYGEEICSNTVQYVPYHFQENHSFRSRNRCMPKPTWPFISCGYKFQNNEHTMCNYCKQLSYYHILQRGMPAYCRMCFMPYSPLNYDTYTPPMYSVAPYPVDDFYLNSDDWYPEKTMCEMPDGTISENCNDIEEGDIVSPPVTSDPLQFADYDDLSFHENHRRRRHTFTRSKYSHRNLNNV